MPLTGLLFYAGLLLPLQEGRHLGVGESPTPGSEAMSTGTNPPGWRPRFVAAHRGGYFGDPNTISQFLATLGEGAADILEMDLRKTSDGAVVVFHDDVLDQKTNCSGTVEALTMQELSGCTLARNGFALPAFAKVLDAIHGRAVVDAEFKTDTVVAPAIAMVQEKHAQRWVYFQVSSDRERYQLARRLGPDISLQFKASDDADLSWALSLHDPMLTVVEMDRDFIDASRIERAHGAGKLVSENSWRYQFSEERWVASCDRAFEMGVDIAVTNNPTSCTAQKLQPKRSRLAKLSDQIVSRQRVRIAYRSLLAWARS